MTSKEIIFTRLAVRALYLASRTCGKRYPDFNGEIKENEINLNQLFRPFFATRPTLWVTFSQYLKKTGQQKIDKMEVVRFYSLFHINFVNLFAPHFEKMAKEELAYLSQQGFSFDDKNADQYLFACLGRVGKVVQRTDNLADIDCSLAGKHSLVENVIIPFPENIMFVAVHFGNAYAVLTEDEYYQIQEEQVASGQKLYLQERINYQNWCGGNLSEYTLKLLELI